VYVASPAAPHGVVCDIDDTVWVTGLRYPLRAAWRTFVDASSGRRPVPGMAALLRGLVRDGPDAPVIYLSTGPWNLAGAIVQFLARHDFPPGALLLTDWGCTPRGWFRDGRAHKRDSLVRVAADLPDVRWVLVGDDGQHDPEIYAEFARRFPDRAAAIALRKVTPGARLIESLQPLPKSRPSRTPGAQDAGAVPVVRAATGERLLQLVEPHLGSPVICRDRRGGAAAG
jgi:phosphatidate phosphatase APP1